MIKYDYGEGAYVGVRSVMSLYGSGKASFESLVSVMRDEKDRGAINWGLKWGLITEEEAEELVRVV